MFVAENGPFGAPFLTPKITPKKFMWVPLWHSFLGSEAHKLFSGDPKWGVLGGAQKVYVERVYALLRSPKIPRLIFFLSCNPIPDRE